MAAILVVAALLALEVSRLTLAVAVAEKRPGTAEALAPRSPQALAGTAMAEVGKAAAYGRTPPASASERLHELARVAPLSPEPFLVEAALALRQSDLQRAERLLVEARRRDPRSRAARYLLAETLIRQGRLAEGLGEIGTLARLLPGSSAQLAPVLAQFADAPGALEPLKRILAANQPLKQPLLNVLAADPDNLPLILELDQAAPTTDGTRSPPWQSLLLNGLVARGDYDRAYQLWQRFAGIRGERPLLYNSNFSELPAPPPFNWSLASGRAGLAEAANGQMRVLHYGRENATLASQLLLLKPGSYTLSVPVSGTAAPGAIAWTLTCLPSAKSPLMQLPLSQPGRAQATFQIPSGGCPAQKLELVARASDMPKESDILLGPVSLERAAR